MQQRDSSRRRRVRRRFAFGGVGLAAVVALLAALAIPAAAVTVNWTGGGTTNGLCDDPSGSGNLQTWHFVLTSPDPGPWTLTAEFDDAGILTDQGEQQGQGGSVFFFVTTGAGDTLLSASATNGSANSQLTVSDCVLSEGPPPTTEAPPETTAKPPETTAKPPVTTAAPRGAAVPAAPARPPAAVAAVPRVTG
jgi:hypothetical protein